MLVFGIWVFWDLGLLDKEHIAASDASKKS